jgi:hypothetical protein
LENLCAKLESCFSKVQVNSIQKKLREKPLVFLFNSGHCGIDYMQSLLDSHHQILITPEYSFIRSWNNQIDGDKISSSDEMFSVWKDFFINEHWLDRPDDQRFLNSESEFRLFFANLSRKIHTKGIEKVDVFWAIHESYVAAKCIDTDSIKIVVAQEHLNFYFQQTRSVFPESKVILMMRDPRAAFGGIFHKMSSIHGYITDGTFNFFTQQWMQAQKIWKHLSKLEDNQNKIVKLEDLQTNKKKEMNEISNWLGVEFNEGLLRSTYPNTADWKADTCYKSELKETPDNFFSKENIRKRWLKALCDKREILMIESLLDQTMKEFEYERITKKTFINKLKGFYYFFNYPRGKINRMFCYYPDLNRSDNELIPQKLKNSHQLLSIWKLLPRQIQFVGLLLFSLSVRFYKLLLVR